MYLQMTVRIENANNFSKISHWDEGTGKFAV